MATKLTLRLDEKLIDRAKVYAKESGRSLSKLVADFFSMLDIDPEEEPEKTTPIVKSLRGILHEYDVSLEDYKKHIEKKNS